MNALELARALGGDVAGPRSIVFPGPGHSPQDRSLVGHVRSWMAPDGVIVNSFCRRWLASVPRLRSCSGLGYRAVNRTSSAQSRNLP